jgi:hypothetical protein
MHLRLLLSALFIACSMAESPDMSDMDGVAVEIEPEKEAYVSPQPQGDAHFAETFDSGNIDVFKSRWVKSESKKEEVDEDIAKYDGEWNIEAGQENPLKGDLGLSLKSKAKHHAVSAFLNRPFRFKTEEKPFIIQYDLRFQEGMECGGSYIKLLSEDSALQLDNFNDKTPYTIMFGPDKCGNEQKFHFIFKYQNPTNNSVEEKHLTFEDTTAFAGIFSDKFSHLLTLAIETDSSFTILLDQKEIRKGSLLSDFKPSVIPSEEVDDPNDKKPEEWDERAKIADPSAEKPEDWDESQPEKIQDPESIKPEQWLDDEPQYIPDHRAEKPDDWEADMDGEWEAPLIENVKCKPVGCGEWKPAMIANPLYKGKWRAPMIENPEFKGIWKPAKIANPHFFTDDSPMLSLAPISAIGLELWSMSSNILFDNFLVTSDRAVADQWAADTWAKKQSKERRGFASSDSVVDFLYKATDERPWLWLVYALIVILPITCCISLCLSQPKKKAKKPRSEPVKPAASSDPITQEEPTATAAAAQSKDDLEVDEADDDDDEEVVSKREDLEEEEEEAADEEDSAEEPTAQGANGAEEDVQEAAQPRLRKSRKD